jgi:hypothetical protein
MFCGSLILNDEIYERVEMLGNLLVDFFKLIFISFLVKLYKVFKAQSKVKYIFTLCSILQYHHDWPERGSKICQS